MESHHPEYRRLYVIGDIHGRLDLLNQIIDQVNGEAVSTCDAADLTISLGDYIDRGPDSRGVLERLRRNPFFTEYTALKGNHERLLERFLNDSAQGRYWLNLGGLATLESYGVRLNATSENDHFAALSQALRIAMPIEHREFLAAMKTSIQVEGYFFCHAGVRPGIDLNIQDDNDLLWIRDEFLRSDADFGKIVVHGHSPIHEPEVLANRINIDTAAFMTGKLTCLVLDLETGERRFLYST
jgi:serine/threonine protein phosphatase 1